MQASSGDRLIKILSVSVGAWGVLSALGIATSPPDNSPLAWLAVLCGFSFLGFCVSGFLRKPCRKTRVLAVVGLGCSLIFLTGPGFESQMLGSLFSVIRSGLVLAGFAAMLHFLLIFPQSGTFAEQARNIRVLYLPAFLFWLLVSYRAIFSVEATGAINTFTYVLTGLIMVGYFLFGLVVFLRRYIRTPIEERGPSGMRLMLLGSIAGFLPAVVGYLPALSSIPGNQYFFVSLAVLPLAWSRAAVREE
jgi:hypothetical protein